MAGKRYLFTPGPTPVPPEVLEALSRQVVHHRGPDFRVVLKRCLDRLKAVFRTSSEVLLFTASGTGAMESAVANLCSPGSRVVVERWEKFYKPGKPYADRIVFVIMAEAAARDVRQPIAREIADRRSPAVVVVAIGEDVQLARVGEPVLEADAGVRGGEPGEQPAVGGRQRAVGSRGAAGEQAQHGYKKT